MIAAEFEATQQYTQLAESSDNKLAAAVLKDIADEEWVHIGEFLRLLNVCGPPPMMEAIEKFLSKLHVDNKMIVKEAF